MYRTLLVISLFSFIALNSQTIAEKDIVNNLISLDFNQSKLIINELKSIKSAQVYLALNQILFNQGQNKKKDSLSISEINTKSLSEDQKIVYQIATAYYSLYYYRRSEKTYKIIHNVYVQTKKEKHAFLHKLILLAILDLYARENTFNEDGFIKYLSELKSYSTTTEDELWNVFYKNLFLGRSAKQELIPYLASGKRNIEFYEKYENTITTGLRSNLHENIAIYYKVLKKYDSSKYYLNKIIELPYKPYLRKNKFIAFLDMAQISVTNGKTKQASKYYNLAQEYFDNADKNRSLISFYRSKAHYYYYPLKKYDSAYDQLNKSFLLSLKIAYEENISKISQTNVKLNTAEKEKENLELKNNNLIIESQRIQNRNLLIGSLLLLFFGVITALLIHKNTKRKQRIAEQEREIEIQKTEKLLKDQELNTIDAMISGQEKERQRIANDLHDNLGSALATVKLHFDHLKNNRNNPKAENIEELYIKTDNLLNEAYQKVRTIAHEKNSGVMANQGLLPAIKNLAKKVSNGNNNGLHIEIQEYGLEERLDNALEISIFRIIQELITNTIKHAHATEIHISLTNHDSLLNIIVEDNGKGFNATILPEKDGMGLKNIEKRIENMEGTFEIDATIGKGTNIIINIPI